ncbi:GmrSD restriction endonuclease domain-containing protein [Photobacterium indicum]|uniref:DUF262 domain-containing protein n=1 Tax=Photobacterium indicum TaxID=81447 RepID=A0A2T3L8L4_9GAMM|nr:DUF262 domain-containing protein [Photobacterium indicum]PSV47312.1 hypothetical protein C9J47_10555 [Photobacterium indicum]
MDSNQSVLELSVAELFQQDDYIIPIYQRNYAWGESEVEQLLQDVWDIASKGKGQSTYYIGSLVAYKRDANQYETIDGQQRHTTLSIILSVLKNEFSTTLPDIHKLNLGFDSRPKSVQTLRKLFNEPNRRGDELEEANIRSAYEISKRFLSNHIKDIAQFSDYLLNNVRILRVIVPEDTDLNHYFEIMNNRGEQLEKHEVLKARLMSELTNDDERNAFASVWDACSEMNRYVQLGINSKVRSHVFGSNWNHIPQSFEVLCQQVKVESTNKQVRTMADIIGAPQYHAKKVSTHDVNEEAGTFGSVINFSNFLLHVLRVTLKKDIPLDDKRLLDTFAEEKPNARQFALDLLKCRMLFDRYIIKRENDEDWSLKTLTLYERNKRTFSYTNSASEERNQQLIMLLSMFHVSFPTLVYKHWLNASLHYLYANSTESGDVDSSEYTAFLEKLSDRFFFGRFGQLANNAEHTDYLDLTFADVDLHKVELDRTYLNQGTGVQNFIFNRLDYKLWKQLKQGKSFSGVNMDYIRKRVAGFSFSFRTSVEHYFPQNPLGSEPINKSDELPIGVDSFGNLCLISRHNNSKLSNYLPTAKKEHYEKATTVESLKQIFMMSYDQWGVGSEEGLKNIADHETMMIKELSTRFV